MNDKDKPDRLTQETGHALYNIFSTIRANAELVIEDNNPDAKSLQRLQRVMQACRRGEELVRRARDSSSLHPVSLETAAGTIRQGGKVLVVDDEQAIADLISRYLGKAGVTAIPFSDSREALQRFLQQPGEFSLVITDYDMPDLNGIEFAALLYRKAPGLPVILISGDGGDLSRVQIAESGIISIMDKPIERETLLDVVCNLLPEQCQL